MTRRARPAPPAPRSRPGTSWTAWAVWAVRAWVRLYTAPLPRSARRPRRAELAADLHDHVADLAARGVPGRLGAREVLRRSAAGVAADLAWTVSELGQEVMRMREQLMVRRLAVAGWACAVVVAALGLWSAVAGLQDGWRELPGHWWSALAAAGAAVSVVGLVLSVAVTVGSRRSSTP